jgi:hypothetical protein
VRRNVTHEKVHVYLVSDLLKEQEMPPASVGAQLPLPTSQSKRQQLELEPLCSRLLLHS